MPDLTHIYAERTLIFGHRGAKAYAPMNTLPAFELALAQGADGVELDVQLTKDGFPVVCHDFTVDRTTNGTGRVSDQTLAELKELDAGGWFSDAYAGVRIPTLDEVFAAVGQQLLINVEIKSEMTDTTDGLEQVIADCIVRHAMQERVIVSSFNPFALRRFRAIAPTMAIGFLADNGHSGATALMQGQTYEAYHPYFADITPEMVAEVHAAGRFLNTWTVNDPVVAERLRDWGVNGIITDNPDILVAALAR